MAITHRRTDRRVGLGGSGRVGGARGGRVSCMATFRQYIPAASPSSSSFIPYRVWTLLAWPEQEAARLR